MGKKTVETKKTEQPKEAVKKLSFATMGSIFPTKKEGRKTFKPKLGKFGVKSIEVTLNNGDVFELDEEMFIMVSDKTIKTKNGEMDIQEMSLAY